MTKLKPIPKGEVIEDAITKHMDRRFLSSLDFMGQGIVELTIDRIEKHKTITYANGKTEENVILAYFKGTDKPLSLCSTNIKAIVSILQTTKVSEWSGRKIKVTVKVVDVFGKQKPAVRVVK